MYPIQSRLFMLLQEIRRAYVCGEHGFFDQTMSIVALHGGSLDLTLLVEYHLRFDGFEIDCAPLPAGFQ